MIEMPITARTSHLRSLLSGLPYFGKFLSNLSERTRSITDLLENGAVVIFTEDMNPVVRDMLKTLNVKPVLRYQDWSAEQDGSRFLQLHPDASTDGFGAVLDQSQFDGSGRPILQISHATMPNEVK